MELSKILSLLLLTGIFFLATPAHTRVVKKIIITGNRKIETETIRYKLITKESQKFSPANIKKDIKAIFSLGYCSNISVEKTINRDGTVTLKYIVKEKPVIKEFEYRGNSAIDLSEIKDVNDIKPYSIINRTKLNKTIKKISSLYEKKGFYLAEINYHISSPSDNEVTVTFNIVEHDKVLVKKIILLGNSKFSDEKLKSFLSTKEGETSSWLTNKGTYSEDALKMDIERIKGFYYTQGYIQVKTSKPEIVLSPDKKFIYITFSISEGLQFYIGKVALSGDFLKKEPKEKLKKTLLIKTGDLFNRDNLSRDIHNLTQVYEDYGYAFANVIPKTNVKEKKRIIDITLDIDKGQKVYFGKITIKGNTRTRDKVVRREMKINEGELYNGTNLRKSRENIFRLGYFSEVNLTQPHSKDKKNVLDIEISVKEKQTGSLQVGAGFSSYEKFMGTAQVSESNFLGYGQTLSLQGEYAKRHKKISTGFKEPYLFDSVWSSSIDFYYTSDKKDDFEQKTIGGAISLGYPVGEFSRLYSTVRTEYVFLNDDSYDKENTFFFPPPHNDKRFYVMDDDLIYALQATIARDTRDNRFDPSKGTFASASYEYNFGSFSFHRFALEGKYFHPLFWSLVSRTWLRYGRLFSQGDRGIPTNRRYVIGGIFSVRGYMGNSIGPKTTVTRTVDGVKNENYKYTYGGAHKIILNQEIQFDIIKEAGLKGVVFYDAGNTYDEFDSLTSKVFKKAGDNKGLYMSMGWGFRWFSPLGPLRFEFGYPLPYKKGYNFEFMIGNFF